MTTPRSLTRPVTEIPVADIPAVRAALVAEADELITRSDGDTLAQTDAGTFRQIEAAIGVLDQRSHSEKLGAALERIPGMAAALDHDSNADEPQRVSVDAVRPAGLLPSLIDLHDDELREFHGQLRAGHSASLQLEMRDVTSATVPQALVPGQRLDAVPIDREPTRIAALLPSEAVTAPKVTFYQQTTAATAAAVVAEGGDKPESSPAWEAETVDVRKIAHFSDISWEALEDYANMRQVLATELNVGLVAAENAQLLSGSGSGINIRGLLNATGILTYAPVAAEAWYRSIRTGIRDLRTDDAFAEPDTIVLHPNDAMVFDLSNDTTAGLHAVPDLTTSAKAPIWGLRRVETTGIAAGTALVMDSRRAAVLFVRQAPMLFVDPYSQSSKNMTRVIVEERIGLGILNPACMLKITFNDEEA